MAAFSRLWGLDHLRPEDWQRFVTDDGKQLPSLAEKVIQQASKEASKSNDKELMNYITPYLDKSIVEYPDNIWIILNKAKLLLTLEKNKEALQFAIEFAKKKSNEYWAWGLLGDIISSSKGDSNLNLSCYCRALLCSADEKFLGKIRLKLATLLVEQEKFAEAKFEINSILIAKQKEGNKIPSQVQLFTSQPWYAETNINQSNKNFYKKNKGLAEDLLFDQLPWISANVGEVFTNKENKPKLKIYLKSDFYPTEITAPKNKYDHHVVTGEAIRVKGEWNDEHRFQMHLISQRKDGALWDVFTESLGVVDHINSEKELIHYIVDQEVDGVIPFSEIKSKIKIGDIISVKISRYYTDKGVRYRTLSAIKTNKNPPENIRKKFTSETVSISNTVGFTESGIFIPSPIVANERLQDGDAVSGVAIINYNKKRNNWGWKAISVW